LEKWPLELVAKILPRHLEIIHMVNYFLHEKIMAKYSVLIGEGDDLKKKLSKMSIIEV
jgi:starch phosphorylase